jgi:hypothetical protein
MVLFLFRSNDIFPKMIIFGKDISNTAKVALLRLRCTRWNVRLAMGLRLSTKNPTHKNNGSSFNRGERKPRESKAVVLCSKSN